MSVPYSFISMDARQCLAAEDSDKLDGVHAQELEEPEEIDSKIRIHASSTDAHHEKTTSLEWIAITNRPAGLDDSDDVGVASESDPTVAVSVKDGVSWSKLTGIPDGFADAVDDVWGGDCLWSKRGTDIYYNNGNVGIGTMSPAEKLEIYNGNLKMKSTMTIGAAAIKMYSDIDKVW